LIWRPILEKITTLQEIENHYSLVDLLEAHIALDFAEELKRKAEARKA
jgi:hypothetical protein